MIVRSRLKSVRAVAATLLVVLTACIWSFSSASAFAAAEGPGWMLTARTIPTNLSPTAPISPAVSGTIKIDVFNVGAKASTGTITVTDVLPAGVEVRDAGDLQGLGDGVDPTLGHSLWNCTGNGLGASPRLTEATVITCTNAHEVAGGGGLPTLIGLAVEVKPGVVEGSATNRVAIAGGGSLGPASTQDPITISTHAPGFGLVGWDGWFSNSDGTVDTQAGSHPYEAVFSFDLASMLKEAGAPGGRRVGSLIPAGGEIRNLEVELPPGFIGNPGAVPTCTRGDFAAALCPNDSQVGNGQVLFALGLSKTFRVFNLVPPPGAPAEFGFIFSSVATYVDSSVRSGRDYGITSHIDNIAQREAIESVLYLWGNPADPTHTQWRNGDGCSPEQLSGFGSEPNELICKPVSISPKPFLTLPTACGDAQPFVIRANTWTNGSMISEAKFLSHDAGGSETGFTGCERLVFGPSITVSPDTSEADHPTGLTVDVKPPLGGLEQLEGFSSSDIRDTTVTLPPGLVINPGQAAGLQACQPPQDGLTTEAEKAEGKENDGPPSCPLASKVGTVRAKTPLLEASAEKELEGDVYVLQSNPPNLKLLAAFSADGVNVKLVLNVHLDETTGQLTTTVANVPEFPVNDFKLSFSGGAQAALDTPPQCGTYLATSDFTPWSTPFVSDLATNASFGITAGPGGAPCPSAPMPFAPSMVAGSTTDQAGGFTDFSLLLQRGDGQQRIEKLQFEAPRGLSGMISRVQLCDEPNANAGTCPAASHIGHAVVASGPGPYPLVLPQPGEPELPIYLTGPYKGSPFGLSIVTPVLAGPFNLGTIVTRARIDVDSHTAQITVTTDPLPQIVDGVPTDLRSIDAVIDRAGFMFNPTNCEPQAFSGTATSAQGAVAGISSRFGVGSCQSLKFAPKFSVTTPGHTSRANGAGLTAKLSYPSAAQGTQANITRVKVDLPKQLPSRLTTLQKACTAVQFEANPAGCPQASIIGHATVTTPVLPVPLTGPTYFVSHGGEAFPSLTMVLQGDGVTVDLVGATFISRAGITSTTFKTVPDVPFNTFALTLPQGRYSALAANGNLCKSRLAMPTEFLAQNGLKINRSTPIGVSGCAKTKALTRAQKLTAALKACHGKAKPKRGRCVARA
ncbi:MAG TPA: hypothetical protein VGG98_07655, partial [Solirubrobacteraceae bacterium]